MIAKIRIFMKNANRIETLLCLDVLNAEEFVKECYSIRKICISI